MYFPNNDGSQKTFLYQPTLNTLELQKDKGTGYIPSCKSKEVYNSKLESLYTAFLHSANISGHRIVIIIDKSPLTVEQTNY